MAKEPNVNNVFKLPQEAKDRIKKAKGQFAGAKQSLEGLKNMGIDVSDMLGTIAANEKLVDKIIKQFKLED